MESNAIMELSFDGTFSREISLMEIDIEIGYYCMKDAHTHIAFNILYSM